MTYFKSRRVLNTIAATALSLAIAGTAAVGSASASPDPSGAATKRAEAVQKRIHKDAPSAFAAEPRAAAAPGTVSTPAFDLTAVDKRGSLYLYPQNLSGGLQAGIKLIDAADISYAELNQSQAVDNDKDGLQDGFYFWWNGQLSFTTDTDTVIVGGGWGIYDKVLSPGDLGGAAQSDIIGIDKAGVLWTYLAYADGRVTPRTKIGSGWDAYTQIAGQGDLTGDGRADIVARDKAGVLWLYKGTGDYKAPFAARTKIGAGWNMYDKLVSIGDMNNDGTADLLARAANGDLYYYRGTGNAAAPYAPAVKIGFGYDMFRLMAS
ncbi:VCBS repeat-containing protein [Streptomyces sp. NBC_00083]|uniref:FG-GAP repeat domain-containing protein n=1 Tax=Streptomyces sp. NBC_00083 TaxID=2975647 RepID=UPI00225BB134|nr:VCBS repeat-containing protein [Streptomyces sp. NBC_00083]MCX5384791.1 VCBS repeat-containing protein [Streptomyces sp. NBC_00083]